MRRIIVELLVIGAAVVAPAGLAHALCGDLTGDGNRTVADAQLALRFAVGQPVTPLCSCEATTFAGLVTNASNPTVAGAGVSSEWVFDGNTGVAAGDSMCVAIGADHVCTYEDLVAAREACETLPIPENTTFWVHRLLAIVTVSGQPSVPGRGGRCNDWISIGNNVADGEYAEVLNGDITYFFDNDTIYDENDPSHLVPGLMCGGVLRAIPCCN